MSSTSADFQNSYQAPAAAPPAARMRWRWRLRIGAICTAIRGYSERWRSLTASGRCAKAIEPLAWESSRFLRSPICRAGSGHRSGPFQHSFKQAESEELVGHIAPRAAT